MQPGTFLLISCDGKRRHERASCIRRNPEIKDAQGHPEQLKAMKLSLWHWICCTLMYSSGVFVRIDSTQPLYDGRQLTSEGAGFLTLNQLADFTLPEVEDLIPVLALLLTPIYGAIGILRYPTKPLRLASETLRNPEHLYPNISGEQGAS